MDTRTKAGQAFIYYSSRGELVPDEISIELWEESIRSAVDANRFKPELDILLLDGIPRNSKRAKLMKSLIDESAARAAVIDYGQAVKDLAATNIFPGDLFPKNFGVTRHGRAIFYDYDELWWVTDCDFRELPAPTGYEEEIAAEPWYFVHENDIFPEEFPRFLWLSPGYAENIGPIPWRPVPSGGLAACADCPARR